MNLFVNEDGACAAAKAVRAYLAAHDGLESVEHPWDQPSIARWYNCSEQGYVVTLHRNTEPRQLNIAFFEHRNSDSICAVEWTSNRTVNPPTIDNIPDDHAYKNNKYATSHDVSYTGAQEMADWIYERLEAFARKPT